MIQLLTSIYHFVYVFFIYDLEISKEIFFNYPILFASFLIFSISILLFTFCRCRNYIFHTVAGVSSTVLFMTMFYLFLYNTDRKLPNYFNPISFILIAVGTPLEVFIASFFIRQINLITKGLTTKQLDSIKKNQIKIRNEPNTDLEKAADKKGESIINFKQITCRRRIKNLIIFLRKKRPGSLLTKEYLS